MCLTWRELQTNKLCQHSVCSLKRLFPGMSIHFYVAPRLCLSNTATWLISSFPVSYIRFFPSLHLHPLSSTKPVCTLPAAISTPTTLFLSLSPGRQAGRQASRLGAQMVFWRVSQLWVSEPAGRQHGPSVADMAEASPGTCL